jgi:uncharacterized membrane protein
MEATYNGLLPGPNVLRQYNDIEPGTANRIILMAEQQAAHLQLLEKKTVYSGARDSLLGVVFAFILGMFIIDSVTIVILNGHSVSGTILCTTGISTLVGTFIYGTLSSRKERKEKNK